ncbi:hypothetical protein FIE12Z_12040 [Fusarium flagelliforme]|uniref:Uncharacterized protein n=1 Tax=Fusarium flagelliforme TaxID=2675880 RepID=A0A395M7A0_9HYPO|nr:hypothetical protein FIE12Z_12040 [Fusarium flagelliforme]
MQRINSIQGCWENPDRPKKLREAWGHITVSVDSRVNHQLKSAVIGTESTEELSLWGDFNFQVQVNDQTRSSALQVLSTCKM